MNRNAVGTQETNVKMCAAGAVLLLSVRTLAVGVMTLAGGKVSRLTNLGVRQ